MKKHRKKIISFAAVAAALVVILMAVLLTISDDTLKKAGKGLDTIAITAKYNAQEKTLAAEQCMTITNGNSQALSEIKFHIYANAYRDGAANPPVAPSEVPQAYPNGKNFGGITIHELAVGGRPTDICIEEDDTVLCLHLDKPLKSGQSVHVDTSYTVQLANIKHRLGWTDDTVNLANFYPVPCIFENGKWQTYPYSANGDPFYNELHNFDVKLTAPRDLVLASSGTIVKSTEKDGKKTTQLKSTAIRDFAMVMSKNFKNITKKVDNTIVRYYYLKDDEPQKSLVTSVKALQTFSRLFVKYPYKQLAVVQTDFMHGGMEYGELVYVSRDLLDCNEHDKDTCRADHDRVIVHEIAHQWWYGIIGNNQSRTAWIDEGLAEYSTLLFYDKHPEYFIRDAKAYEQSEYDSIRKQYIENARANYTAYVKIVKGVGGEFDPNMDRELGAFNSSYEYVFMTYVRGLLLFCDLENILTKNNLVRALKDFANCAKFTIATRTQLVDCIEKTTKAKVAVFFETYLSGF